MPSSSADHSPSFDNPSNPTTHEGDSTAISKSDRTIHDESTQFDRERYVQHTAALLQLPIPPDQFNGVVENFARIQTIAAPVLAFSLANDIEAAPTFKP